MSVIPVQPSLIAQVLSNSPREKLRVLTGDWLVEPHPSVEQARGPAVVWEVRKGNTRLRPRTPISVKMWSEGRFVFVENETLRVFAHGLDTDSALQDFNTHVVYFYNYYSNLREDQVVGEGLRLKRLFEDLFRPGS